MIGAGNKELTDVDQQFSTIVENQQSQLERCGMTVVGLNSWLLPFESWAG